MRLYFIILLSVLFLSNESFAKNVTHRNGCSNLTIRLDSSFSITLLETASLISTGVNLEISWEYDRLTKSYICHGSDLPNGKYELRIKTIFENTKLLTFNLTRDTSFVITKLYDLIDLGNLDKAGFKTVDSIRIYFKSTGCFHNFKERIILRKNDDKNYKLTYCYDTIAYKRIKGRLAVSKIPVYLHKNVNATIIERLFLLVNDSQTQRRKALETGLSCISTTHESLFILINNSLFQFSDSGLCDWDLYSKFKKEFIE